MPTSSEAQDALSKSTSFASTSKASLRHQCEPSSRGGLHSRRLPYFHSIVQRKNGIDDDKPLKSSQDPIKNLLIAHAFS